MFRKKAAPDYSQLPKEDRESKARAYVLWLLARRDYSRIALETKLKARKLPSPEIQNLLEDLIEKKWFRPEAYPRYKIRKLALEGYSPYGILKKLTQQRHPVSATQIRNVLLEDELDLDALRDQFLEGCLARHKLTKNTPNYRNTKAFQRALRRALSRGYAASDLLAYLAQKKPLR